MEIGGCARFWEARELEERDALVFLVEALLEDFFLGADLLVVVFFLREVGMFVVPFV
jgi:hypothetical protein